MGASLPGTIAVNTKLNLPYNSSACFGVMRPPSNMSRIPFWSLLHLASDSPNVGQTGLVVASGSKSATLPSGSLTPTVMFIPKTVPVPSVQTTLAALYGVPNQTRISLIASQYSCVAPSTVNVVVPSTYVSTGICSSHLIVHDTTPAARTHPTTEWALPKTMVFEVNAPNLSSLGFHT